MKEYYAVFFDEDHDLCYFFLKSNTVIGALKKFYTKNYHRQYNVLSIIEWINNNIDNPQKIHRMTRSKVLLREYYKNKEIK